MGSALCAPMSRRGGPCEHPRNDESRSVTIREVVSCELMSRAVKPRGAEPAFAVVASKEGSQSDSIVVSITRGRATESRHLDSVRAGANIGCTEKATRLAQCAPNVATELVRGTRFL